MNAPLFSLPVLLDDGTHKYVWGLGLAYAVDTGASPLVYHADGLGSVRALTDGGGAVVEAYSYDEYGDVIASSGSISQPFRYVGEQRATIAPTRLASGRIPRLYPHQLPMPLRRSQVSKSARLGREFLRCETVQVERNPPPSRLAPQLAAVERAAKDWLLGEERRHGDEVVVAVRAGRPTGVRAEQVQVGMVMPTHQLREPL